MMTDAPTFTNAFAITANQPPVFVLVQPSIDRKRDGCGFDCWHVKEAPKTYDLKCSTGRARLEIHGTDAYITCLRPQPKPEE